MPSRALNHKNPSAWRLYIIYVTSRRPIARSPRAASVRASFENLERSQAGRKTTEIPLRSSCQPAVGRHLRRAQLDLEKQRRRLQRRETYDLRDRERARGRSDSRVSKERIMEAVGEAVSPQAAKNIVAMKKGDMANAAEGLLSGKGWLPQVLWTPASA